MAQCTNCGTQVQDGVPSCPSCGAPINAAPAQQPPLAQPYQQAYQQPPQAAQTPADDAQANKVMAILAYILFFVPLLAGAHKTSPFAKFHTNQGTVLFIFSLAYSIVLNIVRAILSSILWNGYTYSVTWGLWSAISTVISLLGLVPLILVIIGIVNAAGGKMKELPLIGKFKVIK